MYHQDLMPCLLKMIKDETLLKLKAHTVQCCVNFVRGLINEGTEEKDAKDKKLSEKGKEILKPYLNDLV